MGRSYQRQNRGNVRSEELDSWIVEISLILCVLVTFDWSFDYDISEGPLRIESFRNMLVITGLIIKVVSNRKFESDKNAPIYKINVL